MSNGERGGGKQDAPSPFFKFIVVIRKWKMFYFNKNYVFSNVRSVISYRWYVINRRKLYYLINEYILRNARYARLKMCHIVKNTPI